MNIQHAWKLSGGYPPLNGQLFSANPCPHVLFTDQREEVFGYPADPCEFCKKLRQDPEMNRRCICCDQQALDVVDGMKGFICDCHAVLTEAIVAFRHHGRSTGYLMIGQFLRSCCHTRRTIQQSYGVLFESNHAGPSRIRQQPILWRLAWGTSSTGIGFHALADTPGAAYPALYLSAIMQSGSPWILWPKPFICRAVRYVSM